MQHGFAIANGNRVPASGEQLELQLKASDSSIELAVRTDGTVMEAFFMGGRGYWTVPLSCDALTNNTQQGISLITSGGAVRLLNATVWAVHGIHLERGRQLRGQLLLTAHAVRCSG